MPSHQFLNPPGPYPHPPPCTSIVLVACSFRPKTQLCTLTFLFFFTHQALQLFIASHWKCLLHRVFSCRSLPIPTIHMSYNFVNTFLFLSLSLGLRTRPFRTPVLGASRRKAKQGKKQLVLCLCSCPPSSPYPSLTFALFSVPIPAYLPLF
jgi:hypothetical protein